MNSIRTLLRSKLPTSPSYANPILRTRYCKKFTTSTIFYSVMQEYKLKLPKPVAEIQNGDKVEVEVEGIEDAKVVFAKVNGVYRALGPRCTRKPRCPANNLAW